MTGLPIVCSSGGSSPLSVMLMLLGPVCSEVLRAASMAVVDVTMFSGSVLDLKGAAAVEGGGWTDGASDVAVVGVVTVGSRRVEAWEGLRESMVGMGVGLGAGRV